ncbi:MAG: orotate phosphoribosyltransferase, partial [Flammeovirgaceae bacterium]|nr:orotate phosphoribosyltransferase [Flammeovirgaceae bacterium]MDW8288471.1 orotate phosphoribosyltransferase [Flammeovirgaceae bacterium]
MKMTKERLRIAQEVALRLLECGAVRIQVDQPFTWTSGWKSPIYCDNRLTLSFPEMRDFLKNALVQLVRTTFPAVEAVAGVATAGIPQGVLLADMLRLPFLYVRSSPKGHGLENLIEGKTKEGAKIVLVEDLISTGGSSLKAALALREAGYRVEGLVAMFTYGFEV